MGHAELMIQFGVSSPGPPPGVPASMQMLRTPRWLAILTGRDEILMGRTGYRGVRVQGVTMTGERPYLRSPVLDASLESFERDRVGREADRVVVHLGDMPTRTRLDEADVMSLRRIQHLFPWSLQHARTHQGHLHLYPSSFFPMSVRVICIFSMATRLRDDILGMRAHARSYAASGSDLDPRYLR